MAGTAWRTLPHEADTGCTPTWISAAGGNGELLPADREFELTVVERQKRKPRRPYVDR